MSSGVACDRAAKSATGKVGLDVAEVISLGSIKRGSDGEASLVVRNLGAAAVEVARIESSCPCLTTVPGRFRVEAGSRSSVALGYHSGDDPDFTGRLGIELVGHQADDVVAFRTRVDVVVEP